MNSEFYSLLEIKVQQESYKAWGDDQKPCVVCECAKEQNLSIATCLHVSLHFLRELFGAVGSINKCERAEHKSVARLV